MRKKEWVVLKGCAVSLEPGDMLRTLSTLRCFGSGSLAEVYTAVLRVENSEGQRKYWLSAPTTGDNLVRRAFPLGASPFNPFHWDTRREMLVSNQGIRLCAPRSLWRQPGGAKTIAAQYARVPRLEHLEQPVDVKALRVFMKGPLSETVASITINGEAGPVRDQVALVLQTLGISCTEAQRFGLLVAVQWMVEIALHKYEARLHNAAQGPITATMSV